MRECACTHVNVSVCLCASVRRARAGLRERVCLFACMRVCVSVTVHAYVNMCLRLYVNMCVRACVNVCVCDLESVSICLSGCDDVIVRTLVCFLMSLYTDIGLQLCI